VKGDLANWHTGAPEAIPAVGGAMDLAIGAKRVYVMMEHLTKQGESKIVQRCTYPLTGVACVNRVFTDLAVLEVTPRGMVALERCEGLSFAELQRLSGVPLIDAAAGSSARGTAPAPAVSSAHAT
jgi:3-oxoadipate CoA-transferase beta subunit